MLQARARRHGVGTHFQGLLVLLGRLAWVLTLHQRLLDNSSRLVRGDGLAAFERPGAGAAGRQQRECEQGRQEGAQVFGGGRALLLGTMRVELRTLNSELRTSNRVFLPRAAARPPFDPGLA